MVVLLCVRWKRLWAKCHLCSRVPISLHGFWRISTSKMSPMPYTWHIYFRRTDIYSRLMTISLPWKMTERSTGKRRRINTQIAIWKLICAHISLDRFQTPYFWPSNCWEPENTDYAVYLCKRTMQNKTRLELADYEAENLARLQKMFSRKWEFIFMQVIFAVVTTQASANANSDIFFVVVNRPKRRAKWIRNAINWNERCWTRRNVHSGMFIVRCPAVWTQPKWTLKKRIDAERLVMVLVRLVPHSVTIPSNKSIDWSHYANKNWSAEQ